MKPSWEIWGEGEMKTGKGRWNSSEPTVTSHTVHSRLVRRTLPVLEVVFLFHLHPISHCVIHVFSSDEGRWENRFSYIFAFRSGVWIHLQCKGDLLGVSLWFRVTYWFLKWAGPQISPKHLLVGLHYTISIFCQCMLHFEIFAELGTYAVLLGQKSYHLLLLHPKSLG